MAAEVLLEARDVSRRYGSRVALQGFDLVLHRGECVGLLGLNGAGKSTALQILAGVIAPHGGRVEVCGHDLVTAPLAARRSLGFLPEFPPLHTDATIDEYLAFCAALRGVPAHGRATAVARAKQACGLAAVGGRLIRNLSKGYQQRAGIAQAVVHDPAVVILDEPSAGLDPLQLRELRDLVREASGRCAVLLSTHLLIEAETLCSRVVVLHEGRIAYDAPTAGPAVTLAVELRAPPPRARLAAFEGVTSCAEIAPGRFELGCRDGAALAERLAETAAAECWRLCLLAPRATALEQVFVAITSGRRAAGAA